VTLSVRTADGAQLVGEAHGPAEAPTLVFLNSIGCDRRLWDSQVAALADDFRCLVFDTRGHGQSDAPAGDYTLDQLGRDALAVLDAADVRAAHVCGLSLGGLVAQWLAIEAPERVARMVLADTASRIGTVESWEARRKLVLDQGLAAIADMAMERFFSTPFRETRAEAVAEWRARLAAGSAKGYAGCCAALRDADLTAGLARITSPTLVICGEEDISTPPEQARALATAIPGAELRVIPAAAHLANFEQPDAFNAALRAHLEAH
jgi:3-oxoadipate enol-lactonase